MTSHFFYTLLINDSLEDGDRQKILSETAVYTEL